MPNEIIPLNIHANLPSLVMSELNVLRMSPERYYAALVPIKADDALSEATPTLAQIQQGLSPLGARLAVSVALIELAEWFNVQRNLTDRQIAMIAEMIIKHHWDLSLNDLKGCFQEKMATAKLYGKLDGSDILGWLSEYKAQCIEAKQKRLDQESKQYLPSPQAITYEKWAAKTPKEKNYLANGKHGKAQPTDEERAKKEAEFQKFRRDYLAKKGIQPK